MRRIAVLSLAQVDVLAVEKLLLHAWLTGWLPVIVMEALLQEVQPSALKDAWLTMAELGSAEACCSMLCIV